LPKADVVELEEGEEHPGEARAEGVAGEPDAPIPERVSKD
jgi:hypothetical protein